MNKGLEIRQKKLRKKCQKRNEKKANQIGVIRFVDVKWEVIEKINGKYIHTGMKKGQGLQIENRVYLLDGHYKMLNSRAVKVTKVYVGIPEWATEELKIKFNNNNQNLNFDTNMV